MPSRVSEISESPSHFPTRAPFWACQQKRCEPPQALASEATHQKRKSTKINEKRWLGEVAR